LSTVFADEDDLQEPVDVGVVEDEEGLEDDDVDLAEVEEDEEEEEDEAALAGDEEDTDQASLEELLAQRAATRRAVGDSDEDADIMSFPTERDEPLAEPLPSRATPINRQEFVCSSCHLVKPRVQLADEVRGLCRDCV
jgi:hypothetical protein